MTRTGGPGARCDRCGCGLDGPDDVRYEVRIDVRAAVETPQVTFEQLVDDHRHEIRKLIRQIENTDERELMREVASRNTYTLCASCQKAFVRDPLGREGRG